MFDRQSVIEEFKYQNKDKIAVQFHTHPKYEIYYFCGGKCRYVIGGTAIELVPGDLIIMNGIREHGPIAAADAVYHRTTILFDGAAIRPYIDQFGAVDVLKPFRQSSYMHWRLEEELKLEWESILDRMHRFYVKSDPVSAERLRHTFMDALLFIAERFGETADSRRAGLSGKEKIVQHVMGLIESRYMDDLSIADLAKDVPVSRFYLMKVFKELTGVTVFDYLNRRRIGQAKVLLSLNSYNVTEISFMVGFKHVSHFSRNFKKVTGAAPEEYRKRLLRDVESPSVRSDKEGS